MKGRKMLKRKFVYLRYRETCNYGFEKIKYVEIQYFCCDFQKKMSQVQFSSGY